MAKTQDLKIQKALTAELKKQREILAAHTKESKNYKDSVKKIQEMSKNTKISVDELTVIALKRFELMNLLIIHLFRLHSK